MKLLVDGVEVVFHNDVKVIWDSQGEDSSGELHLTATYEGIIIDKFDDGSCVSVSSTASLEVQDLSEMTH